MQKSTNNIVWISRLGLGLILCYCLAASILCAVFAQIHITLPFLPFPIFIGEILLVICLILFLKVSRDTKLFDRRSIVLLGLYFGWVVGKALINYHFDGPLTCRNAALFYYPVFAVFAYCFYQTADISRKWAIPSVFLAAVIMFFKLMTVWCWWTYVTLFVIAVWNTRHAKWRWLGWIFLTVIFLLGKEYLYKGPRAHFVSVFGVVGFLAIYFGALLYKHREYARLSILLFSFISFIIGIFIFSNRNAVHSVVSLNGMINTYQYFDKEYQERQAKYVPEKLQVHFYNPKKFESALLLAQAPEPHQADHGLTMPQGEVSSSSASLVETDSQLAPQQPPPEAVGPFSSQNIEKWPLPQWLKNIIDNVFNGRQSIMTNILCSRIREGRSLGQDDNNIVFRLFVWRDMAHELIEQRAWWGFSFGHPQRSRSLEVLGWAESEWSRDGWITPHNSFFHIIYRAGILGVVLIGILFYLIAGLVRDFFRMSSVEGGLLVGALVYWMVLSNFFVILEFPYNAIIIWTLFGITWAYRENLVTKSKNK